MVETIISWITSNLSKVVSSDIDDRSHFPVISAIDIGGIGYFDLHSLPDLMIHQLTLPILSLTGVGIP